MPLSPCLQNPQESRSAQFITPGQVVERAERSSIPFQAGLTWSRSAMWMLHINGTSEKLYHSNWNRTLSQKLLWGLGYKYHCTYFFLSSRFRNNVNDFLQPINENLRLLLPALRWKHVGVCENEEPSGIPRAVQNGVSQISYRLVNTGFWNWSLHWSACLPVPEQWFPETGLGWSKTKTGCKRAVLRCEEFARSHQYLSE